MNRSLLLVVVGLSVDVRSPEAPAVFHGRSPIAGRPNGARRLRAIRRSSSSGSWAPRQARQTRPDVVRLPVSVQRVPDPDGTVNQLDNNSTRSARPSRRRLPAQRSGPNARSPGRRKSLRRSRAARTLSPARWSRKRDVGDPRAPVVTDPNLRSGNKCIYKPTTGISPYVELSVDMGDARRRWPPWARWRRRSRESPAPMTASRSRRDRRHGLDDQDRRRSGHDRVLGWADAPAKAADLRHREGENVTRILRAAACALAAL